MVFPCFHFRLGYKCCHIINDYLIKLYRLLSVRRKHKPSVKQSVDKNRSNRFLTSAIRSHICTRFGRYLHSKTPSRIIRKRIEKHMLRELIENMDWSTKGAAYIFVTESASCSASGQRRLFEQQPSRVCGQCYKQECCLVDSCSKLWKTWWLRYANELSWN